jgi:Na+-translocating ferredoxin:NAD+ oxidoreductase RnfC subunit
MMCSELCPRNLLGHDLYPDRLMRSIAAGVTEDLQAYTGAYLCSECGLCATYSCVMNLDPCAMNAELKTLLGNAGIRRPSVPRPTESRVFGDVRHVPALRLIARLGLSVYDLPARQAEFSEPVTFVSIPLRQHVGAPAEAQVVAGDAVVIGQLIGEIPKDKLAARVHSSVYGVVREVTAGAVLIDVK